MQIKPSVLYQGTHARLIHNGRTIGTVGTWKVCTFGDDRPYLTASGCNIPALWHSAGLDAVSVVGRPLSKTRQPANPLKITGEVKRIGCDVLSLGNITIEGAADETTIGRH